MKVFGLDFTSSPKQGSKAKLLTLAVGELESSRLTISGFRPLTGGPDTPFKKYEDWLKEEGPWIAGIDFPFGMPLGAIEYFRWLEHKKPQTWGSYVRSIHHHNANVDEFTLSVERWSKWGKTGDSKRVFLFRYTDRIGGFGGTTPSSPMKLHPQCNPPVGRMFFEGSDRLRKSGVSVEPVRRNDDNRVVVEAYPRLVADKFLSGQRYKDAKDLSSARDLILRGLRATNEYGVTVTFKSRNERKDCIQDDKGDLLDSVLCAVQAAWAYQQEQHNAASDAAPIQRYGIPRFGSKCMAELVQLEGWIVDPLLLTSTKLNDDTTAEKHCG